MPNPSVAFQRPELALLLQDFDLAMDRAGFVGQRVFLRFDAGLQSANAQKIAIKSLLETRNTARNPDGTYPQTDFQFEQWNYATRENGLEMPVDSAKRAIFANYFDAEVVATMLVQDAVLRNQERRIADAVFNITTFGTAQTFTTGEPDSVSGANTLIAGKYKNSASTNVKWSTFATATPIYDVQLAQELVYANSGLWPDTVVLSKKLAKRLKQCAQIIDRIKYTKDPDTMSTADLANAFDVRQVLIAGGSKNTADALQSATAAQIWDTTMCSVCKVAENVASPWDPGIGRTFYWNGDGGETVETYYSNEKRADVVRMRHYTDEKMMYSQAAALITSCA